MTGQKQALFQKYECLCLFLKLFYIPFIFCVCIGFIINAHASMEREQAADQRISLTDRCAFMRNAGKMTQLLVFTRLDNSILSN